MPRIPESSQLGYSVGRNRTPQFQDRSGQIIGNAVDQFAGTVGQVANVLQEREDKFSYAQAKSTLLQADIEARRSLENDQDWETYEKRYTEGMAKAREKAGQMIRSKNDRALFEMDAKLDAERGIAEVRGLSKRKEVDTGLATLDTTLTANRTAALEAADEPTRTAFINSSKDLILGAKDKGYIKETDAVGMWQTYSSSYAEGFIDVQPLKRQIEVLKKPDGTPAQLLTPDRRANLLKSALNEQRILDDRAKAEAKAAQSEYRHALNERVRDASASYRMGLQFDNPPSKSEFILAMGVEDGAKAFAELQKDQDLSADLSEIARLPPAEQREAIDRQAPTGTAGAAEQAERYNILRSRAEAMNRAREADPASYVATYSPRIQEAYQAFSENPDDPDAAQTYAQSAIAEQQRLGVRQPQILPKQLASSIAESFKTKPEEGEKLAAMIRQERDKWGRHWPKVAGQLMQEKMPASAIAIARGMSPGASTRLATVSALPMEQLKKGVDTPPVDIADKLKGSMSDLQRSLGGVVGAENTFSAMYEAAERLTYSYLREGMSLNKATEQAYDEVIGDHYGFEKFNGHVYRIPIESDTKAVRGGAEAALSKVNGAELLPPIPTSTGNEFTAGSDLTRMIEKRGYWVTSANGERGLALFLDGAPVLKRDGSVYELTWEQLEAANEERKAESLRESQRRSEFTRPGLR